MSEASPAQGKATQGSSRGVDGDARIARLGGDLRGETEER
jgi:hypothetical protein